MSIVLAVRKDNKTVIAADTVHFYGSHRETADNVVGCSKIRKLGSTFIGSVGWAAYDDIMAHYFKSLKRSPLLKNKAAIFAFFLKLWRVMRERYQVVNDQPESSDSPFADLDSNFLVVNRYGIFEVSSDLSVTQYSKYVAIGSGNEYAFGALYAIYGGKRSAERIAITAAEAAAYNDKSCGGEIEWYALP